MSGAEDTQVAKPRYRAKLNSEDGTVSVFVWVIDGEVATVTDEIDTPPYSVDSGLLSSIIPMASGWV